MHARWQAATECVDCEAGKFAPFPETTHMCYPCGVGQYSTGGPSGTPPEYTDYVGCVLCLAGEADHDSDGGTPCIPCAAGTYSRAESQSCRDCLAGFVDEDSNPQTECTVCSAGFFSAGSEDAEFDGSNPEVYALVCAICEAGTADLDGQYDGDADGHCATGTVFDPHHPGDYVPVDTQQECHGVCSLTIPLPTHDHTEAACLALGECFDAGTCVEAAASSVTADAAACAAVSGGALNTATACDAVMLAADGVTSACTYTSVVADATACAAVDLSLATARADCLAVGTAADTNVRACVYTPAAGEAVSSDWAVGDVAATGCAAVGQGYYDHDKESYTAPLQCAAGNMVGECIRAECRDSGGALVRVGEALVQTAAQCSADSGTNTFNPNAVTLCSNTGYFSATICTPVPVGSYDDDDNSITPPIACLRGSTTDTLDQPGAASCALVPAGFYDHDSVFDGAPFCTDPSGDLIADSADPAAIRPTELYCQVSGATVSIVNPSLADVAVGEIRISSAAGLANPLGAYVGNYAQQAAQGDPFTLHAAAEYTQYLDYNFYETASLYMMRDGSQTFQMGLDYPVGPLHDNTNDIGCLYVAPDGTEVTMPVFAVTQTELDCVAIAGNTWSRHETFQSSTTAPEKCQPGSTTDTMTADGAISCTEAPAGEFDHDSACDEVTGYCRDDSAVSSCIDVNTADYCPSTGNQEWRTNPELPAATHWCMTSGGDLADLGLGFHANQAACETFYTCDGTVAADAGVDYAAEIGGNCNTLYGDPSSAVATNACTVSGCVLSAAQSTGRQFVEVGCYQGATLRTVAQICDALAGHDWLPSDTFYSSTTPPRNCAAQRPDFLGALVGGSTTYTQAGYDAGTPAGTATGATLCIAAPVGEYDHDIDPTTGPIECTSGHTTNTREVPGAITCEAAPIGHYDDDLSSTTIPIVCEKGSNTYLPTGVAAVVTPGATICELVPPGLYDHDSTNDGILRGTEGAAGWGYCSETDGRLTVHTTELTCTVTAASCTGDATDPVGTPDCAAAFSAGADTTANSCPHGCDYVAEGATGRVWHPETRFYSSTTLPVECAAGSTTTFPAGGSFDEDTSFFGATGCVAGDAGLYDHDSTQHGTSHTSDATCTGSYREFTHGVQTHPLFVTHECVDTFATAGDGLAASCPAECDFATEHYCVSPMTVDGSDVMCAPYVSGSEYTGSCTVALYPEYADETTNTDASCTGTATTPTCAYVTGTEGCPFGCLDDGTTCSGLASTPTCDLEPTDGTADCPAGCTHVAADGCTARPGTCYAANGVDEVAGATDIMACEWALTTERWTPPTCVGTISGTTDDCAVAYAGSTSNISPAQGGSCTHTSGGLSADGLR